MAEKVAVKMHVTEQTIRPAGRGDGAHVTETSELHAVTDPENEAWAAATPYAEMSVQVDVDDAQGFFEPGSTYVATFEKVEEHPQRGAPRPDQE